MKNNKYISILIIICIFIIFSLIHSCKTRQYRVIKVQSPAIIYPDINNNGIADDFEKINILQDYQLITKDNIDDISWKGLNIDKSTITAFAYLTEKYLSDFFQDKFVEVKKKSNSKLYVVESSYVDIISKSGYLFKKNSPTNSDAFNKRVEQIKKNEYKIYNTKSGKYHLPTCKYGKAAHNYVLLSKYQIPKGAKPCKYCLDNKHKTIHKRKVSISNIALICDAEDIKVYLADYTTHFRPNRYGNTKICNELVNQINSAKYSIDIAIYGYDRVPKVEQALKKAIKRGVKIRLVYDVDSKGGNIYSNTNYFANLIKNNNCDRLNNRLKNSAQYSNNLMHDKFYIFDDMTVITGSANLSYTDMSDFNHNAVILIKSKEIAQIYKIEFEQMYNNYFHTLKKSVNNKEKISVGKSEISVYFSPTDKIITNKIIPIINSAKKYIYMPVFLITDKSLTDALIKAKSTGVDVKIIVDATNAKNKYSSHHILRGNKIPVKTENYAGKLHSKSIIIDDKYTIIGSMNFTKSGELKNDENVVIIKNSSITKFYKQYFLYLWSKINNYWLNHDVSSESVYSIGSCSDGIDNDYDGLTDMDDEGCKFKPKLNIK